MAAPATKPSSPGLKKPALPTKHEAVRALRNAIGTHLNQVQDLFSRWDRDRSGTIDKDEFRKAMRAFQPVSYTHLTLPTICSV